MAGGVLGRDKKGELLDEWGLDIATGFRNQRAGRQIDVKDSIAKA